MDHLKRIVSAADARFEFTSTDTSVRYFLLGDNDFCLHFERPWAGKEMELFLHFQSGQQLYLADGLRAALSEVSEARSVSALRVRKIAPIAAKGAAVEMFDQISLALRSAVEGTELYIENALLTPDRFGEYFDAVFQLR